MTATIHGTGIALGVALLGAVFVILGLRALSRFVFWLPLSRGEASGLRRWLPVATTCAALLYVTVATRWLLSEVAAGGWVLGGWLLIAVAASWSAIRDATDGLFLRATGACRTGDYVQLGELEGRVRRMGFRFLTLQTSDGHIATVPYGRVAASSLRRLPEVRHGLLHLFQVELPRGVPVPVVKRRITTSALLCPWCVPKQNARIRSLREGRDVEVTLSLIDADHAAEAEEVVRNAVAGLGQSGATAASGRESVELVRSDPPTARESLGPRHHAAERVDDLREGTGRR